jgi:hypothetical protein
MAASAAILGKCCFRLLAACYARVASSAASFLNKSEVSTGRDICSLNCLLERFWGKAKARPGLSRSPVTIM